MELGFRARYVDRAKAIPDRGRDVDMILMAEVLAAWLVLSLGMDLVEAVVVRVRRDDEQILPGRR
jgi:hypothetical protein